MVLILDVSLEEKKVFLEKKSDLYSLSLLSNMGTNHPTYISIQPRNIQYFGAPRLSSLFLWVRVSHPLDRDRPWPSRGITYSGFFLRVVDPGPVLHKSSYCKVFNLICSFLVSFVLPIGKKKIFWIKTFVTTIKYECKFVTTEPWATSTPWAETFR